MNEHAVIRVGAEVSAGPTISCAVMHHPARAAALPSVLAGCASFHPRVIADPDPGGIRSPLRTAKLAWHAASPHASHHLVLQDDVELAVDFSRAVVAIVARNPDAAVALYVNWNSPQNSYHARRAIAAGCAEAPLSRHEYTPALGLVLPVAQARRMAEHLRDLPDELRDDDEAITRYCREFDVPVVVAVPNLVEHRDSNSLAGYDFHGPRRSVAFAAFEPPPVSRPRGAIEAELTRRTYDPGATEMVVELIDSRCQIRFLRPGSGEPVDHPYGWSWREWGELVGVPPRWVLEEWRQFLAARARSAPRIEADVLEEVWAAGYLLGVDTARVLQAAGARVAPPPARGLAAMARSWVVSGLAAFDRKRMTHRRWQWAQEVCVSGVRAAMGAPKQAAAHA